jgi:hypothetical protein
MSTIYRHCYLTEECSPFWVTMVYQQLFLSSLSFVNDSCPSCSLISDVQCTGLTSANRKKKLRCNDFYILSAYHPRE